MRGQRMRVGLIGITMEERHRARRAPDAGLRKLPGEPCDPALHPGQFSAGTDSARTDTAVRQDSSPLSRSVEGRLSPRASGTCAVG